MACAHVDGLWLGYRDGGMTLIGSAQSGWILAPERRVPRGPLNEVHRILICCLNYKINTNNEDLD